MTEFFNKREETAKRRVLRNGMPEAERLLWQRLKGQQLLGLKFRRQYSVEMYVIDFDCPALKLAIEIDGGSHLGETEYDAARQLYIESFGIRFLRFTNVQIFTAIGTVITAIEHTVAVLTSPRCEGGD